MHRAMLLYYVNLKVRFYNIHQCSGYREKYTTVPHVFLKLHEIIY